MFRQMPKIEIFSFQKFSLNLFLNNFSMHAGVLQHPASEQLRMFIVNALKTIGNFASAVKKFFPIALLSIFMLATVGIVITSYSCDMKRMKSNSCCTTGKKDCCEKRVTILRVKDDFVSSPAFSVQKSFTAPIVLFAEPVSKNHFPLPNFLFSEDDHAPPGKILDRLSFIQSFLI